MDGSYAATFGYLKYLYTDELDVDPKVILGRFFLLFLKNLTIEAITNLI